MMSGFDARIKELNLTLRICC